MNKEQKHRIVRKIYCVGEMTISDHRSKKMVVEIKKWHGKTEERKKVPRIM